MRKVVPKIINALKTPVEYSHKGTSLILFSVSNLPQITKITIEATRATRKKVIFAVIDEPKYLETELFIGRYIESIAPIINENKISIVVCILLFTISVSDIPSTVPEKLNELVG